MQRRNFLGLGLTPLALARPARATPEKPMPPSHASRTGSFPNVPLVTHENREVRFYDDLIRGRTVLCNFFLVRCTDGTCPTAIRNLRQVQDLLGERMGRDIFFYSITLQPETDTPEVLKDYAEAYEARPGWEFLTGAPADIERLRRRLGYVDPDPKIDQDLANHTNMARYGCEPLRRWAAVSLRTSPANIASMISQITL